MATKVMVSFPDNFLAEVDRIAREEHRSRSELLCEAMRLYIKMRRDDRIPSENVVVLRAVATQDDLAVLSSGIGEDSVCGFNS